MPTFSYLCTVESNGCAVLSEPQCVTSGFRNKKTGEIFNRFCFFVQNTETKPHGLSRFLPIHRKAMFRTLWMESRANAPKIWEQAEFTVHL